MPASREDRRLRGLAIHFAVFLVVMLALAAVIFLYVPGYQIFILFAAVIWGTPLSLHVAYVMGLFDSFRKAE